MAAEEASFLQAASARINLQGLLLGGIVIGSLGVLDDVTVTQASAVWALHQANPALGPAGWNRSAPRIGRDLLVEADQGVGEIVPTLVGSIGLVAAVPVTTALAAVVVAGRLVDRDSVPPAVA